MMGITKQKLHSSEKKRIATVYSLHHILYLGTLGIRLYYIILYDSTIIAIINEYIYIYIYIYISTIETMYHIYC
jgi:hypothetical protein